MSQNVYDILMERGFIEQATHEDEIREMLGKESVTFYKGFDATADSLTAGHFLTIMAMMHMQRAGHRPIALLGGGTTMIGDPSGKSDTVSYTHLDVYKRQDSDMRDTVLSLCGFKDGHSIHKAITELCGTVTLTSCLLYTSRCV